MQGHCVQTQQRRGKGGSEERKKTPDCDPQPDSFLSFPRNRNMNLLRRVELLGDGWVSEKKDLSTRRKCLHTGASLWACWTGAEGWGGGFCFLKQITAIRFGSFPMSVIDRYAEEKAFGGSVKQERIVWKNAMYLFFITSLLFYYHFSGIQVRSCTELIHMTTAAAEVTQRKQTSAGDFCVQTVSTTDKKRLLTGT